MSDIRALLKAKRAEARITHPYATYTPSNQLKCAVCGSIVKFASAWEGHLGSKLHRTNVIRMREEEKRQREAEALEEAKAKAREQEQEQESDEDEDEDEETGQTVPAAKRKATETSNPPAEKKRKVDSSFPQDFFSDPSRAPTSLITPDSDEEDDEITEPQPKDAVVDLEYERFQRELLASASADPREAYDRATIAAEAVPASVDIAGFPPSAPEADAPGPPELTEDEQRRKREEDDRELIMDRLLEEERAQEDADARVILLKTRLDALRRKREHAKAAKAKQEK